MFSDFLLTVDFDRTLTAPDSTIPSRNLEAIEYFISNGGAFTVNTGRSLPMALENLLPCVQANVPLLLYNGSAAYDTGSGELSQCKVMDLPMADIYADLLFRFPDLTLEIQGIDRHYLFAPNRDWEAYNRNMRCPWGYCTPDSIPGPLVKFSLYSSFGGHTVASMYESTPGELAQLAAASEYLEQAYGDRLALQRPCARILDVQAKGISKGTAARELQAHLGKKYLVCAGDAENDIAMLEAADFPFCPADGVIAHRFPNVCPCSDGAVADVIFKKIPGILRNNA